MTPRWPDKVLPPRALSVDLSPRSLSAPPSISGAVQVVSSDAGIWRVTFDGIPVTDQQRVRAWRGIGNLLEGRLHSILVPVSRWYQPAWTEGDNSLVEPVPHSDEALLSDGAGYVGQVNDVRLAASAALRATTANVNILYGGALEPGQHFSIGERLYRIRTVAYTSQASATITFRPPLREAVASGTRLEFDDPICRMKLASDNEMDMALDYNRWAFQAVTFVEDV